MHGSQSIYPVSPVASKHERRDKKHSKRRLEEEETNDFDPCWDLPGDRFYSARSEMDEDFDLLDNFDQRRYVSPYDIDDGEDLGPYDRRGQLVGDPDPGMDWWFSSENDWSDDEDDFGFELRRRDEKFVELTAD
jgi:hypothetical protein